LCPGRPHREYRRQERSGVAKAPRAARPLETLFVSRADSESLKNFDRFGEYGDQAVAWLVRRLRFFSAQIVRRRRWHSPDTRKWPLDRQPNEISALRAFMILQIRFSSERPLHSISGGLVYAVGCCHFDGQSVKCR
jgi:hypothetical protein